MSDKTAGWVVWGRENDRIRMFHVAEAAEDKALDLLKKAHPSLEIVSRHTLAEALLKFLKMKKGEIREWIAADFKTPIRPGGEPISKKMER